MEIFFKTRRAWPWRPIAGRMWEPALTLLFFFIFKQIPNEPLQTEDDGKKWKDLTDSKDQTTVQVEGLFTNGANTKQGPEER